LGSPLPPHLFDQARGVSSKVFSVVERLASKGKGTVASTFGAAASRLRGLVSDEARDSRAVLSDGKEVAREVWEQLKGQAGASGAIDDVKATVRRITERLKETLRALKEEKVEADRRSAEKEAVADRAEAEAFDRAKRAGADDRSARAAAAAAREMSGHVTFTTGPGGKLEMHGGDGAFYDTPEEARLATLAREGRGVLDDVRADERIRRLVREEIAPGFESLIRASVEVICDLMATLELPRVDGVYDSPLGSVCYHVDDLAFSEFVVAEDGLRVANQTGENADSAGFGSTVSIEGIRTVMNDIRFAYCEFPKNWGVVDSEGLCTVKVDGAKVGISYDIIVNTPELMRLVNRGVELSKNEEKIAELKEKVKAKFANARGEGPGAEGANEGSRRASIDSFHSADEGERRSAGAGADASPATKTSPATSPEFSSPASKKKKKKKKTPNHAAADAALDRAFGGGIFGGGGGGDGEASGSEEEDGEASGSDAEGSSGAPSSSDPSASASGSGWGLGFDAFNPFGASKEADETLSEGSEKEVTSNGGSTNDAAESIHLTSVQKEKLERHRALLRDLLGDDFVVEQPVLELRVHATSITVGELDVEIGGTSAAWLYNMIALVLTQQLRGAIEERINNLTVRQLGKLSGTVAAYSAGLIKVAVVADPEEGDEEDQQGGLLSGWVTSGGLGKLRRDCGAWGKEWQCSHWCVGEIIRRTPSAPGEIMMADGTRALAPEGFVGKKETAEREAREKKAKDEDEEDEDSDEGLSNAAAAGVF
jgi:hypothetical protein